MPTVGKHFRLRPLAALLLAYTSSAFAAPVAFDQSAQSLQAAIEQVAKTGGVSITVDSQLVAGKQAPALKGTMEPSDALRKLLAGSGLEIEARGNSSLVVLRVLDGKRLGEVIVRADTLNEGSAEVGYKPTTAKTTGPWGDKPILDTPYSINSTSSELIENMVSGSTDNVMKYSPVIQQEFTTNNRGYTGYWVRGFDVANTARDGMLIGTWLTSSIEDIERVEVLGGLSGFMYGAGNVGGILHFVTKRPTAEPILNVTAGNYGGQQYFSHVDAGGPIDQDGRFGYRLNAAFTEGDTAIQNQTTRRNLLSAAFDWRPTDDLLLQLDFYNQKHYMSGYSGQISLWGLEDLPSASKFNNRDSLSPEWARWTLEANKIGASLTWLLNESTTVRGSYSYLHDKRDAKYATLWTQADGSVLLDSYQIADSIIYSNSAYFYVDKTFSAIGAQHKLTFGMNYHGEDWVMPKDGSTWSEVWYPTLNSALNAPEIDWPAIIQPRYTWQKYANQNWLIGDEVTLSNQWKVLAGINHSNINTRSYNTSDIQTSQYNKSKTTPSVSVVYKPKPNISTYATYIESLESGPTVSTDLIYTNAGQILPPTVSKQLEGGVKADIGGMLLTGAIFQIDKANTYTEYHSDGTRTVSQDGRQEHKGLELTATGKITDNLTIYGGGTFIDAKVKKTNTDSDRGKMPAGVAKHKLSMYAEYRIPNFTSSNRIYLTGGFSHVDSVELKARSGNRKDVPSFTTADIGLRYETGPIRSPLIARLNISNVTDKHYWLSMGGTSFQLGAPRTVSFSLTKKF